MLTSCGRIIFFYEIFNFLPITRLDFHKIREMQATQLRHQTVSQSESTLILPVSLRISSKLKLRTFVRFAQTLECRRVFDDI